MNVYNSNKYNVAYIVYYKSSNNRKIKKKF